MRYSDLLRDDAFVIYLLHGVIPAQTHPLRNYTRKHLPLDDFTAFLRDVSRAGQALSMNDVIDVHRKGRPLPARAFAVTFDDGFANNATVAAPVLDQMRIPATFYVTTGFIGGNTRSWTDEMEAALEHAGTVRLRGLAAGVDGTYETIAEKIAVMDRIRAHVKGDASIDPYAFAAGVVEQSVGGEVPVDDALDRKVTREEVRALASHPLFTVGGHGHTHRILSFLEPADLEDEVRTSVGVLREITGFAPQHYSYPEGLSHCYSQTVIDTLRRHGIVCAPTAIDGVNRTSDDLFHLRRVFVI
jgi:peptidoglycan/xylan/chitin deacetylase (PgdA/CDA1 family)